MTDTSLLDSEARMRAILETTVDGIMSFDEQGMIESINPAGERMFGYTASELTGRNINILMPPPYRDEHEMSLKNYRDTGRKEVIGIGRETLGLRKDLSTFPMELSISEVRLADRRLFTGIVRDITERKLADAQLAEAGRRKDEFLAILAHELRNPLTGIGNAMQIMYMQYQNPYIILQMYEVMKRQFDHTVRLVDDLLDVSRINHGKIALRKEKLDLREVVRNAAQDRRPMFEEAGLVYRTYVPERPVRIMGDMDRLIQVVGNLINNAIKYTAPGGTVTVSLDADRSTRQAYVTIEDTGTGIDPGFLPRVFDFFSQSFENSGSSSGLGLGLFLVKELVGLHEGTVTVESEGPGKGSRFTVSLPLAGRARAGDGVEAGDGGSEAHQARRILVVDDNKDICMTLDIALRTLGHQVEVVYDGGSAMEKARNYSPEVVILDIGLPDRNGYEVCRELRREPALDKTLFIAQTGWSKPENYQLGQAGGFHHFLVKPINIDNLQQLITGRTGVQA